MVLSDESKWRKNFFQNMAPRRVEWHRALMVTSMSSLITQPWDDHWYFFNSIQVKFYIEVNMYHIHLHNEDWNPKAYVPRKPSSHLMSTVVGSSMGGGTMKWARSKLSRQQCTSKGRTFMGWYITDSPKIIYYVVSMATSVIQSDPYPPKWTYLPANQSCHTFAYNRPTT